MDLSLVFPAFIAGLLTFLAPCTFPLVPGYLGFVSGVPAGEKNISDNLRRRVFFNGLFFVFGFSAIFILFGTAAGLLGGAFEVHRLWLARAGGVFVVLFGLFMLGVVKLPGLDHEFRLKAPKWIVPGKLYSSFILGSTFGLGWTPCVGPVLGSILILTTSLGTAWQGTLLLAIFSFGLAVPFLLIAAAYGSMGGLMARASKYLKAVSVVGGVFLIFLGLLMIFNKFGVWVGWFYRFFKFIRYEDLLDYM